MSEKPKCQDPSSPINNAKIAPSHSAFSDIYEVSYLLGTLKKRLSRHDDVIEYSVLDLELHICLTRKPISIDHWSNSFSLPAKFNCSGIIDPYLTQWLKTTELSLSILNGCSTDQSTNASREFGELVNMSAEELETWLDEEQSQASGWSKDDGSGETVGHER